MPEAANSRSLLQNLKKRASRRLQQCSSPSWRKKPRRLQPVKHQDAAAAKETEDAETKEPEKQGIPHAKKNPNPLDHQ